MPSTALVDEFCRSLTDAGVELVSLNLDAGDVAGGERGLLSLPGTGTRVSENLDVVEQIVDRTGCAVVNALWGNRTDPHDPVVQDGLGTDRLVEVADRLASHGVTVVVETLNLEDSPAFPLVDVAVTAEVVRRARDRTSHANVGLLLDTYHLARMGTDPVQAIRTHAALIGHVQFADAPGRGRPRTGRTDFAAIERALLEIDYAGFVGLEYVPSSEEARPASSAHPSTHGVTP